MQPFETWLKADLKAPVTVKRIDGNLFSGDNQGNLVGVTVTDAGEPATLSGEVRGYFIRSDGNTVIMSGTIDGNKVTVVLPSACYTVVGQFSLVIKVGQVAVGACTGYVYQSNTDSTVDPEHVIPDIDQLLTRVEALEGRATTLEGDVSAQNNTINAIEDGLAIIATGNVHPAIANGQFVYVKGHSSLAEGLYRATAAIGTNATLSTSNLTADGSGGLNALKGDLDSLNSNLKVPELLQTVNDQYNYLKVARVAVKDTALYIVRYIRKTEVPNTTEVYAIDPAYAPTAQVADFTFYQQASGFSLVQGLLKTDGKIQLMASQYNEDLAGEFTFMYVK